MANENKLLQQFSATPFFFNGYDKERENSSVYLYVQDSNLTTVQLFMAVIYKSKN